MNEALLSSKNMNWCTPQSFYDELNAEFHFTLDVASTDKSAKCERHYTPSDDGLSQSWQTDGTVFCNPPYGTEIPKWVRKAYEESRGGRRLSCLFHQGQTQGGFMITSTARQRFDLSKGGYDSQTRKGTRQILLHSRLWWLFLEEDSDETD